MTAPGVVKIRLSGSAGDIAALGALFGQLQANAVGGQVSILTPGGEVVNCPTPEVLDGPDRRANRREPGYRVYLTVRLGEPGPARPGRQDQHASALAQRMTRKRPVWLYGSGCCDQWTPADGCRWHTGRPAMSLAEREEYDAQRAGRNGAS